MFAAKPSLSRASPSLSARVPTAHQGGALRRRAGVAGGRQRSGGVSAGQRARVLSGARQKTRKLPVPGSPCGLKYIFIKKYKIYLENFETDSPTVIPKTTK